MTPFGRSRRTESGGRPRVKVTFLSDTECSGMLHYAPLNHLEYPVLSSSKN